MESIIHASKKRCLEVFLSVSSRDFQETKKSPTCIMWDLSERRDSNSQPSAWKADALPIELLSLVLYSGGRRIRTFEG